LSGTTRVSRYQKGKTNLDFTEVRDSEWQWHQLGHMQVCTSLQTDNHASTPPLSFLKDGCPSCHPTSSIRALKAQIQSYFPCIHWLQILTCKNEQQRTSECHDLDDFAGTHVIITNPQLFMCQSQMCITAADV